MGSLTSSLNPADDCNKYNFIDTADDCNKYNFIDTEDMKIKRKERREHQMFPLLYGGREQLDSRSRGTESTEARLRARHREINRIRNRITIRITIRNTIRNDTITAIR